MSLMHVRTIQIVHHHLIMNEAIVRELPSAIWYKAIAQWKFGTFQVDQWTLHPKMAAFDLIIIIAF